MTNPYHDQNGRFCSKGEMKAIVDQLGKAVANQQAGRGKALSNSERDAEIFDRWVEMKSAYEAAASGSVSEASVFSAPVAKPQAAPVRIQHEALSELMDLGRVVRSEGSGKVVDNGYDHGLYVDEIQYVYSEDDGSTDEPEAPSGWEYLRGFSGQHGYGGPVLHASESMSGGLAEHIIDNPGLYAVVAIEALPADLNSNEESEPVGWGVLRRIEAS